MWFYVIEVIYLFAYLTKKHDGTVISFLHSKTA